MLVRTLLMFVFLQSVVSIGCGTETIDKSQGAPNSTRGDTSGESWVTGETNGAPNGETNGTPNGETNGAPNGETNHARNGDTNGSTGNGTAGANSQTNGSGTNNTNDPQCMVVGEPCVTGAPVNAGFVCVMDVCRTTCDPNTETEECPVGATCLMADQGAHYCQPSDCTGWLDTTNCGAGQKCAAAGNGTHLCVAEGAGVEGDACTDPGECAAGLVCALEKCRPICGGDADCDQAVGERCVGADSSALLDTGVGICAPGCDSYRTGECPAGQGCFPVTSEDGICDDVGPTAPYQGCTDTSECGDSTTCVIFQEADAASGVPAVGRCLPFCDATAPTQAEADATCPGDAFCRDLSGDGQPTPTSGTCLERCVSSDVYGVGACSGPADYCTPLWDAHICLPGGPNGVGDPCDPDDLTDGCGGTSFCQFRGDGTGQCEPYCQPITQSNPDLGCDAGETCRMVGDSAGNIGRCEVACTPDQDFADPTCPEYLRTCHPPAPSAEEFCSASGVTPTGGACDVRQPTCQPGDSCVNAFGRRLGDDGPSADGTCTRSCATFGDASECGATEVCALNWLTASTAVGHCMEQDVDPSGCTEDFQACGNHSVCFDAGQGLFCMELCDLDNDQCSSGTCTQLFQDNDIRVGACV